MSTELLRYCDAKTGKNGKSVCDNEANQVTVIVNGTTFEVDLCPKHEKSLLIAPLTALSPPSAPVSNGQVHTMADAREWLLGKGYEVSLRGRVPDRYLAEFRSQVGPVA